jgi:hypothetical protein
LRASMPPRKSDEPQDAEAPKPSTIANTSPPGCGRYGAVLNVSSGPYEGPAELIATSLKWYV